MKNIDKIVMSLNEEEKFKYFDYDHDKYTDIYSDPVAIKTATKTIKNALKEPESIKDYLSELNKKMAGSERILSQSLKSEDNRFFTSLYILLKRAKIKSDSGRGIEKVTLSEINSLLDQVKEITPIENEKGFKSMISKEIQRITDKARKTGKMPDENSKPTVEEKPKIEAGEARVKETPKNDDAKTPEQVDTETDKEISDIEKQAEKEASDEFKDKSASSITIKSGTTTKEIKKLKDELKVKAEAKKTGKASKDNKIDTLYNKLNKQLSTLEKKAETAEKGIKLYPTETSKQEAKIKLRKILIDAKYLLDKAETSFSIASSDTGLETAGKALTKAKETATEKLSKAKEAITPIAKKTAERVSRTSKIAGEKITPIVKSTTEKVQGKIAEKTAEKNISDVKKYLGDEKAKSFMDAFQNKDKKTMDDIIRELKRKKIETGAQQKEQEQSQQQKQNNETLKAKAQPASAKPVQPVRVFQNKPAKSYRDFGVYKLR